VTIICLIKNVHEVAYYNGIEYISKTFLLITYVLNPIRRYSDDLWTRLETVHGAKWLISLFQNRNLLCDTLSG